MKFDNLHVFHNPKHDAVMVVNQPKDGRAILSGAVRTEEAVQAVAGWVLRESWDGRAKLPVALGWFKRAWAKFRGRKIVHVATGDRALRISAKRVVRITVDVFEATGGEGG